MSKFGAAAVAALREAGFWIGPDCVDLQLVVVRREQYAVARVWLRVGEDICLASDPSDPYMRLRGEVGTVVGEALYRARRFG